MSVLTVNPSARAVEAQIGSLESVNQVFEAKWRASTALPPRFWRKGEICEIWDDRYDRRRS
jgi:hypothetical protein